MILSLNSDRTGLDLLGRPIAYTVGLCTFLICYLVYHQPFYEAFSYGLFLLLSLKFVADLGYEFPIREVISLLSMLQWVIAPLFAYKFSSEDLIYFMPVSKEVYFNYAFPGTLAFIAGMYIFGGTAKSTQINRGVFTEALKKSPLLPYVLIAIALMVNVFLSLGLVPSSLNFMAFLLSGFLYVGLFHNLFSLHKNKKLLMYLVMGSLLFFSISAGMFHEFILWSIFLIIIISYVKRIGVLRKIFLLLAFVFVGFVIQSIKNPYRILTWRGGVELSSAQKNKIFFEVAKKRLSDPASIFDIENVVFSLIRINQGWIISRIMYHTPSQEPYAEGATIRDDAYAVFLPRFLAPDKALGGGRKNYIRYTGLELNEGTSMNISQLGEAYINFGERGGVICMFFYGLILNLVISGLFRLAKAFDPLILLWIPLLFLQVIKAEIDFMIAMNHLFKSSILVFFTWITIRLLKGALGNKPKPEEAVPITNPGV